MTPWGKAWEIYADRWHDRAEARASEDQTWAEIQQRRRIAGDRAEILFSKEERLGWTEFKIQQEIFDRLNPRPVAFAIKWWLDRHGPSVQRRNLVRSWQRARRGWGDADTWDLSYYLAKVIVGSVEHLRTNPYGHPSSITFEEWQDILGAIADGFRPELNDELETDEDRAKRDEAFRLLAEWFGHLWS